MHAQKNKAFLFALLSASFLGACGVTETSDVASSSSQKFEGVATHFEALGKPYGGCGIPQDKLETQNFVALNVFDTPGSYATELQRPIPSHKKDTIGMYDNGANCGRWIQVSISDYCQGGLMSGEAGKDICKGGSWKKDGYNGAKLNMIIADSCGDNNAWCRDNRNHLDLAESSIEKFKSGLSRHWGNRKVQWQFIKAPQYKGDITIAFKENASPYWPAIVINDLENGIHGIEQEIDGKFKPLQNELDIGQSFILRSTPNKSFRIKVRDADGKLINNGRIYEFTFPESCCKAAFNKVSYKTK